MLSQQHKWIQNRPRLTVAISFQIDKYYQVKEYVIASGYSSEIEWQNRIHFETVTESNFLRENAWVVLCSGMKESVIRDLFDEIAISFLDWESSARVLEFKKYCFKRALHFFNNEQKIKALIKAAEIVYQFGFCCLKEMLQTDPIATLKSFPYIGNITAYHLAKNIGLCFAKSDRHLKRIASIFGYEEAQDLCSDIAKRTEDAIPVIDLVLWRFATLRQDYIDYLSD